MSSQFIIRILDMMKGSGPSSGGDTPRLALTLVECRPQRPPLVRLSFDVDLHNPGGRAVWFVLPTFVKPGASEPREVYAAQAFACREEGRVVVTVFLGSGGCQAVLVPPRGQVLLRGLPVDLHDSKGSDQVTLTGLTAAELRVEGQPVAEWIGARLESDARARAVYDLNVAEHLGTHRREDFSEVPLTIEDARPVPFEIDLV